MQKFCLFLVTTLFLYSCSSNFSVKGKIDSMPEQKFKLEELGADSIVLIDSGKTTDKGEFAINATSNEEKLFRIRFEQGKYILLALQNNDQANINGNWNSLEDYQVTGSTGSIAIKSFLVNLRENIKDINTMQLVLDSLKGKPGKDSLYKSAEGDMRKINADFMVYLKGFADTTKSVSSALFAVNMIKPVYEMPYLTQFYKNITTRFPKSTLAKFFADKFLGTTNQSAETADDSNGTPAPDFEGTTPDGKTITLNSFKGKFVLIDFWASWCNPCRQENPNVVKAYQQFKDKNFTIIGISLDSSKEKWTEAIAKDHLDWNQISQLKGWGCSIARNYKVESIPQNFLIDPQGNIIAQNLKGDDLLNKLNEVVK